MQITSLNPLTMESSTSNPKDQAETVSSMCEWWMTTKEEALPGICHWLIHPEKKVFNINKSNSKSHFTPFGHLSNMDLSAVEHSSHSSTSVSLLLILGGVFLILLIAAFITCIKRKKEMQSGNEGALMNARISNHLRRMNAPNIISILEDSFPAEHKDTPPDYDMAVKIKEKEEVELPS